MFQSDLFQLGSAQLELCQCIRKHLDVAMEAVRNVS